MVKISVVIPTYNRIDRLKKMIKALEFQNYPKDDFEVIFISDGSDDGTNEYLAGLATSLNLKSIVQENSGAAAARNSGAQQAEGDLILFLDDDILPDQNLIKNHALSHTENASANLVTGPMITPCDWHMSPWVAWEQALLERYYRYMIHGIYESNARLFYTGNASLKKAFFFLSGCFDAQFRRAEDVEFAYRAMKLGARFIFNPEARGYHYAQRSFDSWLQAAYTYGMNDVLITYDKGVDWLLPQLLKEYRQRNLIFRAVLPLFLEHKKSQTALVRWFKAIGIGAFERKWYKISHFAFGLIYNLQYYQGIADQLGGRGKFLALVRQE